MDTAAKLSVLLGKPNNGHRMSVHPCLIMHEAQAADRAVIAKCAYVLPAWLSLVLHILVDFFPSSPLPHFSYRFLLLRRMLHRC